MFKRRWLPCVLGNILLSISLLSISVTGVTQEQPYYMWTDEEGVLNFSQSEPKNTESTEFSKPHEFGKPLHSEDDSNSNYVPPEAAANARTRELNCMIGEKSMNKLKGFKNIFLRNEDGWWRQISDERRLEKIQEAEQIIKENCPVSDF
jgi:hypothetical protein